MKKQKQTATKRITHAGITIREVRPDYYMIDTFRQGRRQRQCFTSLEEAKTTAEHLAIAIKNEGASVLDLTAEQRADAVKAIRLADGAVTLTGAVQFWMRHNGIEKGTTLQELSDRWIVALRAQGCRETTMYEREAKVKRLNGDLGKRTVASITKADLVKWMDGYLLRGATRDGYRRCYRAMFQYGIEENIIEANPAAGIRAIRMDERLPTPFTVKQVQSIMAAAETYAPVLVPMLAVQFFAGLRPGEASGMDWAAIDFTENIIRVTPETSKVRRTRIIDMNDTLLAWLKPYRRKMGPINDLTKEQFRYLLTQKPIEEIKGGVIGAAGVKWIQDGPRKTFASMHYATHGDAAKLASIMGHTGGHDILFRHYRGLVKKTEAERYWKLRPAAESGNVIQIEGAA